MQIKTGDGLAKAIKSNFGMDVIAHSRRILAKEKDGYVQTVKFKSEFVLDIEKPQIIKQKTCEEKTPSFDITSLLSEKNDEIQSLKMNNRSYENAVGLFTQKMAQQRADLELLSERIISKDIEIQTKQRLLEEAGLGNLQSVIDYGLRKKREIDDLDKKLKMMEEELKNPKTESQFRSEINKLEESLRNANDLLEAKENEKKKAEAEMEKKYEKIKEQREQRDARAISGLESEFHKELKKTSNEYEKAMQEVEKKYKVAVERLKDEIKNATISQRKKNECIKKQESMIEMYKKEIEETKEK